jgi:hypothetical protein
MEKSSQRQRNGNTPDIVGYSQIKKNFSIKLKNNNAFLE